MIQDEALAAGFEVIGRIWRQDLEGGDDFVMVARKPQLRRRILEYQFMPASVEDWTWVFQGSAQAVWDSLTEKRKSRIGWEAVAASHRDKAQGFQGYTQFPNQAIVARDSQGERAGFIWVAETNVDGTPQPHGFVMDLYVALPHRGKGLSKKLLSAGEEWLRERGLDYVLLSVAPHNQPALALYSRVGYKVEKLILGKEL